jgi:hypothetical protein
LISISVAAIAKDSVECQDHLGVSDLVITLAADLTVYQAATFQSDNSFNTIDSLADGNLFALTQSFGAWQCNGSDQILVNTLNFNYPTSKLPRYVSTACSRRAVHERDGRLIFSLSSPVVEV